MDGKTSAAGPAWSPAPGAVLAWTVSAGSPGPLPIAHQTPPTGLPEET
jgi:hypothetical protein